MAGFRETQEGRVAASMAVAADRAALAAERGQGYDRAVVAAARAERDGALTLGREVLASSDGRVLDEAQRDRLSEVLQRVAVADEVADLRLAPVAVCEVVAHVRAATAAWETEQARLAAEARKAEAARRAEATRRAEARKAEARAAEEAQRAEEARRADARGDQAASSDGTGGGEPGAGRSDSEQEGEGRSPTSLSPAQVEGSLRDEVAGIAARYGCGSATVRIDDPRLGDANGSADWYNNAILIRSSTPPERLSYVVAHECVHLVQYRIFDGDVDALSARMNSIYGGSGFSGLEQNADCVTRLWGLAAWHYTQRCGGARGAAAAAIAGGTRP